MVGTRDNDSPRLAEPRSARRARRRFSRLRRLESAFAQLARRRALAIGLVAVISLAISIAFSRLYPPVPSVTDELSYILAADTFAHGRLANPTHPMWVHFESLQIYHQPVYASKFPPGQGLALALGQALTGEPIAGAWISVSMACAAICWMLMAWMPPRWALLGGLMAAAHPVVLLWSHTCWGGAVAMLGGALLLGGMRRLANRPRARHAFWMGAGIAILAVSRPYEGGALALIALGVVGGSLARRRDPRAWRRIALPLAAVPALAGLWLGYYDWRLTGRALEMPYMHHAALYETTPSFLFQPIRRAPRYHFRDIEEAHVVSEESDYRLVRSTPVWTRLVRKTRMLVLGVFRLFSLPRVQAPLPGIVGLARRAFLLMLIPIAVAVLRHAWTRRAAWIGALFIVALQPEVWIAYHYAAPAVGLCVVLMLQGLRFLNLWRWRRHAPGRLLARAVPALFLLSLASTFVLPSTGYGMNAPWAVQRARLETELERMPGRHLVLVRYAPDHRWNQNWISNRADIDGAKVVWAREMDPARNRRLLRYFHDRDAWLVEPDAERPGLIPYREALASAHSRPVVKETPEHARHEALSPAHSAGL